MENVSAARTTRDCNTADLLAKNYSVMMIAMKVRGLENEPFHPFLKNLRSLLKEVAVITEYASVTRVSGVNRARNGELEQRYVNFVKLN